MSIYLPTTFMLYLSGFRPHISVWIEGNELQYNAEGETSVHKIICPSDEHWLNFWLACETLDIWSWYGEYIMNRWKEGYKWGIEIEYGERRIRSCGISMYPGKINFTAPLDKESYLKIQVDTWNFFTHAVEVLLGGLPFMWSDWRPYEFPTHEQIIFNKLASDLKSLPAEPRDGIQNDLGVSIVNIYQGWFQLRITLPKMCVFAETDDTMTPGALSDLNHAVGMLTHESETVFVDFDNESADTARIIMTSNSDGMTRLTIMDWCAKNKSPRLDIKAPTAMVVCRFQNAVSEYSTASHGKVNPFFINK